MAHSTIPYPEILTGEGIASLLAIRDHLSGGLTDTACLVKDIWTVETAFLSKVWPKEPIDDDGPILTLTATSAEAGAAEAFGDESGVRSLIEEIIQLSRGDVVYDKDHANNITGAPVSSLDWSALLLQLLPILLEILKDLFAKNATA